MVVPASQTATSIKPAAALDSAAPAIRVIEVCRHFGAVTALDRLSLEVARGEYFALLGPSGCGKTTLLRLLAGLDQPDAGEIWLGGKPARELPPHRRPVNTVFQSYALFPHLTVRENVAFGLRMKRVPAQERERRTQAALDLVQIRELSECYPAQLSGGQKQRVALARALVNEPEVLLLDEPLAALDQSLRRHLQAELKTLQRRLGITFIHVTHDQEEALALSDRLAVLHAGRLMQAGAPRELYEHPRSRFVAEFFGACNLIPARPDGQTRHHLRAVNTPAGRLWIAQETPLPAHEHLTLAIRPEHIRLEPVSDSIPAGDGDFLCRGRVCEAVYAGADTRYLVELPGLTLRVLVPNRRGGERPFQPGDPVSVELPPTALQVLED